MKIDKNKIPSALDNFDVSQNLPKGFEWKGAQYLTENIDADTAARLAAMENFPYWKVKGKEEKPSAAQPDGKKK